VNSKLPRLTFLLQYARFGCVGIIATVLHLALFATLIEGLGMPALPANALAFTAAVTVSFLGHARWTFGVYAGRSAFGRFAIAAFLGLLLNSAIVWLVMEVAGAAYGYALAFMATVTPTAIFLVSRFWIFGSTANNGPSASARDTAPTARRSD